MNDHLHCISSSTLLYFTERWFISLTIKIQHFYKLSLSRQWPYKVSGQQIRYISQMIYQGRLTDKEICSPLPFSIQALLIRMFCSD
ncbi:hypothetical protein GDO81_013532 [Engystomops pustulosus]|uniref:Uncharacterized protein n=1 Tax=Engystomops pustulosus TaxID=76066 RepID=A0AAV7B346_ENGPU|nr:hypothetical protein GDO81_013532 [Engystomops pustulosus]